MRIVKKNGFTLAELIVTIALIAIAATIIMISLSGVMSKQSDSKESAYDKRIETLVKNYVYSNIYSEKHEGYTAEDLMASCRENSGYDICKISTNDMISPDSKGNQYITASELAKDEDGNTINGEYWVYWKNEGGKYVQAVKKYDNSSINIEQKPTFDDIKVGDFLKVPLPDKKNESYGEYIWDVSGHYDLWVVYKKIGNILYLVPDESVAEDVSIEYWDCDNDVVDIKLNNYLDFFGGSDFSPTSITVDELSEIINSLSENNISNFMKQDIFWVWGPFTSKPDYCLVSIYNPNELDKFNAYERISNGDDSSQHFYFQISIGKNQITKFRSGDGSRLSPYNIKYNI